MANGRLKDAGGSLKFSMPFFHGFGKNFKGTFKPNVSPRVTAKQFTNQVIQQAVSNTNPPVSWRSRELTPKRSPAELPVI